MCEEEVAVYLCLFEFVLTSETSVVEVGHAQDKSGGDADGEKSFER